MIELILKFLVSPEALLIIPAVCFMGFAAFFTSSEVALISCDRARLRRLNKEGNQSAGLAIIMLDNIESLLITTQFGTNLSIAMTTTLATICIISYTGSENEWILLLVLTPLILLLCDSLPKAIARNYSEKVSLRISHPLFYIKGIFSPVIRILEFYTHHISKIAGMRTPDTLTTRKMARHRLQTILESGAKDNEIKLNQKRMIRNILDFSHQSVRSAMIPLINIDLIENECTVKDALETFETLRHSRIPVYEERVDNIIGIVHFMDLFDCEDLDEPVSEHMRLPMFVPELQQLESLITELNSHEAHMAIVVDEYGGAVGMITKEDVLEEVVGNLSDEFDENTFTFRQISKNSFLANVNIEVDDLNERLNCSLPKGDYETLSGFLLQQFNRIPSRGDELHYGTLKFKVYRCSERSIQSVIVTKISDIDPDDEDK